jgi:transposase
MPPWSWTAVPDPQAAADSGRTAHQPGRARLRAGLTAGDGLGEVAAAWQGKELLRAVYAAGIWRAPASRRTASTAGATASRSSSCPRLARTVHAWQTEILAWHLTVGCSNGPTEAINLLIKNVKAGRPRLP